MSLKQIIKLEVICCHFLSHQTFYSQGKMLKFHILMNHLHNHVQWRLRNRAAVIRRGAKQECYLSKLEHWSLFGGFRTPPPLQAAHPQQWTRFSLWSGHSVAPVHRSINMINYCSPWGPLSPAEAPLSKPGPDCLSSPATHKMERATVHLDITIDQRFYSELCFVECKKYTLNKTIVLVK